MLAEIQIHSSFYACPRYPQVWQRSNQRWLRKAGEIIFFTAQRAHNSKVTGQIRPKFELVWDFMPVLVTCKFDEDWIHSNWEKMETPFSPIQSQWERSRANNSVVKSPTWPKFELFQGDWENAGTPFCPLYVNGSFCCHSKHSFGPKPKAAFPPPQRCYW